MQLLSLSHYWRILAAGVSYTVFGIGVFIPAVYMLILAILPIGQQRKQVRVRKSIKALSRFYVDFMQFVGLMTYYVKAPVSGLPNPIKGHLVIANHSMLIDALFVLAYVDNLCCVVKHDLTVNPFTRLVVSMAGYISNSSDDFIEQATQKLPRALQRGEKWYQLPDRKSNIHIHINKPLSLAECIDINKPRTLQYRRLTEYWRGYYLSKINQID